MSTRRMSTRTWFPRILTLLSIGAAGCLLSVFVSTNLAPHRREGLRQIAVLAATSGKSRRLLSLEAFRDPKTVQPRPVVHAAAVDQEAPVGADVAAGELAPPGDGLPGGATPVRPYTIENALRATKGFRYTLFFFVYDARSDSFVIVHNIPGCDHGCARIWRCASTVAAALRMHFPERFRGRESDDFVVLLSTGDSPRINLRCLGKDHCGSAGYAPVLQFGSVFTDLAILPSAIAMPLPVRPHLPCFDEWQSQRIEARRRVCQDLRPRRDPNDGRIQSGLVFGDQLGLTDRADYWDHLVPQVIWRGTDFHFLHTMFQELRAPMYSLDIEPKLHSFPNGGSPGEVRQWAINALWEMGDSKLLPRWRGVLLTSEAELEAKKYLDMTGEPKLPWANIKFASLNANGNKMPVSENAEYIRLQELGIMAIGEYVSMAEQARFKYHIDLGGGGGTTWTGTIEKLALPGVLFHHMTPTKDWFHDLLVPWEHYIPVAADLSDLRRKHAWAESHPVEAKQIAEQGTQFAQWMGSEVGFSQLYADFLVAPLRRVLDAYRPPPQPFRGKAVLDIIEDVRNETGGRFTVIGRCSGRHSNSCEKLF